MLDPQQANTFLRTASRKQWLIHLDAGTRLSFYGLLPLVLLGCHTKTKRFNSFYRSICIPDNQTGSWPWGPWRSCRAVPHTHGCSGGKPHGGPQSWTPCCPGCCCPRWGSPHPSVLTPEGSRAARGAEGEGAVRAFPILFRMCRKSCIGKSSTIWICLIQEKWNFFHNKC